MVIKDRMYWLLATIDRLDIITDDQNHIAVFHPLDLVFDLLQTSHRSFLGFPVLLSSYKYTLVHIKSVH